MGGSLREWAEQRKFEANPAVPALKWITVCAAWRAATRFCIRMGLG
jgi:hypothetical protein